MADKDEEEVIKQESATLSEISLSQALLAPLDAIFKAQIHSARSFINFVLQLGYPHKPATEANQHEGADEHNPQGPFKLEFEHEITVDGERRRQKVTIPALAAVPINPLAVEHAEFDFAMRLKGRYHKHRQVQASRDERAPDVNRNKRPWFLVDQPVSLRGQIASTEQVHRGDMAAINISVKVGPSKVPAGLNKFITSLNELLEVEDLPAPAKPKTPSTPAKPQEGEPT